MDPHNQSASNHPQGSRAQGAVYDTTHGGHYGASAQLANSGFAPAELYTGPWANVHQGLHGQYKDILTTYWQQTINHLESDTHDYKLHQLPLARIKKVMKADPEVKMISAEAPILFAKGCDIFITELTMRAWIHAEENKRRTLQRSDIASALAKSDMFDFLIDIVPREEASHAKRSNPGQSQPAQPGMPAPPPMGGQHAMPPPPNHGMGSAGYDMAGHAMAPDQDYRGAPIYANQVQTAQQPYGQPPPPMYGDMEGMYTTYPGMQPQQYSSGATDQADQQLTATSAVPDASNGSPVHNLGNSYEQPLYPKKADPDLLDTIFREPPHKTTQSSTGEDQQPSLKPE
ncbi:histone-fold-containing protein [Xylariales sp. PMI_506]|nr:histone-fold-containing protein [Xylariales sp. PMI_506]